MKKFNLLKRQEAEYRPLSDEENGSINSQPHTPSSYSRIYKILHFVLLGALVLCISTHWIPETSYANPSNHTTCSELATRREWRTFTSSQKQAYITAVQCLKAKPSRLGQNHTLYDDFPWVHSRIGEYVHNAAPFLAWHRYFVHVYTSALQQDCDYTGPQPFWDWQLDWQNVTAAPIWSPDIKQGFGTTGNTTTSSHAIVKGYCVIDGPFSNLTIPYLDEKYYPHCLSRGFLAGADLDAQAAELHPDKIEALLNGDEYEAFNLGLENGPHLAIPRSIRGDFSLLTAPSDPVFFLHHAQLDRLWWKWQLLHPNKKLEYRGVAEHGSEEKASVQDILRMGGLAPDLPVEKVLDLRGGVLCYGY